MKIQFVNHSSFVVHTHDISLMCDFWKEGSAFDDGWELLCETEFDYSDFERITHLWISHEHPDHFSPQNLSAIPKEYRAKITVLFQETKDKRVVSFCKKLDFHSVVELAPYVPINIADEVEVVCAPYGASYADVDSWICVRTPSVTLLNINDCEFRSDGRTARIKEACGPIDFLATQFSFASKQGDSNDQSWIDKARDYYLAKLKMKISSFEPRYTLPFASFVFWSHIENRYLNAGAISVHEAAKCITQCNSTPIVMYPQDEWTVGEAWDNQSPLNRYADRYEWLASRKDSAFSTSGRVEQEALIAQSIRFLQKMTETVSLRRIRKYIALQHSDIRLSGSRSGFRRRMDAIWSGLTGQYEYSRIFVDDHQKSYLFSLENGLVAADIAREHCHISISSHALDFCFSAAFGGESLQINGRFQNISVDGWHYLSCIFFLARRIEQKFPMPKWVVLNAVTQSLGLTSKSDPL